VVAAQSIDELQHLRLNRDIERGRRLVGDQQFRVIGQCGGDHDALALTTGEPVRHVVVASGGVGNADFVHEGDCARLRFGGAHRPVRANSLGDLVAHGPCWIEAGGWVLEDHGDFIAAHLPQRVVVKPDDLAAIDADAARHDGIGGQQSHHRICERALSAAAFTHDAEEFTRPQCERY